MQQNVGAVQYIDCVLEIVVGIVAVVVADQVDKRRQRSMVFGRRQATDVAATATASAADFTPAPPICVLHHAQEDVSHDVFQEETLVDVVRVKLEGEQGVWRRQVLTDQFGNALRRRKDDG